MSQVLFFIVFASANGGRLPLLKELEDSWSGSGDLMSADLANFLLHHHYWSGAELWINKWPAHLTNEWPMNSDLSFQWSGHSKLPLSQGYGMVAGLSRKACERGQVTGIVFYRIYEKLIFGELFHSCAKFAFCIRLSNSNPDKKGKFGTWEEKCPFHRR